MLFPAFLAFTFCSQVLAIWPVPQSISNGSAVLWIEPSVKVTYNIKNVWRIPFLDISYIQTEQALDSQAYNTPENGGFTSSSIVEPAISRALQTLFQNNLVPWKLVARNALSSIEPDRKSVV